MRDFHNYKVWKKSHDLTLEIYKQTLSFPQDELFGLTSQIRRASSSIPINVAEGCGRRSDAEFAQFLNYAAGSTSEVEEELLLSFQLGYIKEDTYKKLDAEVNDIKAMLNKLIETLH